MSLAILGLGTALPPHSIQQTDAATIVEAFNATSDKERRFVHDVYLNAGVARRHSAVLTSSSGPLEQRQTFFQPPRSADDCGPSTAERMRVYQEHAPALAATAAAQ